VPSRTARVGFAGYVPCLDGGVAVDGLLTHPDVQSISFVGSTPIARYVYETGTTHGKRVQALGGAKNHMLVLPDADLDPAADQAVNAGYGSAGERCMAISVVLAVGDIGDELVAKIKERTVGLRTGDGTRGCDMGPLVTAQAQERVSGYIDAGEAAGATLVVDGRQPKVDADGNGFFVGPTLFDHVNTDMSIYTDEIFGPVLSVVRVDSYEDGVKLINDNPYGNGKTSSSCPARYRSRRLKPLPKLLVPLRPRVGKAP
jgi:malonate-semialdehyde dehydrogenase (acetylating) / methylmalonate-semialdehyde dehydrogenase